MNTDDIWKTCEIMPGRPEPLGTLITEDGVNFCAEAEAGRPCSLLLYEKGCARPCREINMENGGRIGNVASVFVRQLPVQKVEYNFKIDGKIVTDPFARMLAGRKDWGVIPADQDGHEVRGAFPKVQYDWEGDIPLKLPYEELIMYTLHARGFTKHSSSGVRHKGTFLGLIEKIPYLKDLGVNLIELMPAYEFSETARPEQDFHPYRNKMQEEPVKLNYWGYAPGFYFAPKSAYAAGEDAASEFKDLVKALHREGIELIMEFYFPEGTSRLLILNCLKYWMLTYHVDGFHLSGPAVPMGLLAEDPLLGTCKLMNEGFDMNGLYKRKPEFRNIGEYNDGFQNDIRRFLKGDEDQLEKFAYRVRKNPADRGVVNYITNHNGFTLMDLVSYDAKHNEANGEQNRDGNNYNFSWNCGAEGRSRKKAVAELRRKQIRNALVMLLLSQGTPLLLAGDELGHTQDGNNNAYCQDNEISWLNFRVPKGNLYIREFVKKLIALRKRHPILHMPEELRIMDALSCGYPDLSYHGKKAWYPEFENYNRQIGIMYCGQYAEESDFFYFAYNMHWIPHEFALPSIPKGQKWRTLIDTSKDYDNIVPEEQTEALDKQKAVIVPERTIMVLIGR